MNDDESSFIKDNKRRLYELALKLNSISAHTLNGLGGRNMAKSDNLFEIENDDPLIAITKAMIRLSYSTEMINDILQPENIKEVNIVKNRAEEARGSMAEAMVTLATCMRSWYER